MVAFEHFWRRGAVGRGPCPNVTSGRRARLASFTVVILGVNEAPDFIHLDALAGQFIRPYVTMRGVADGLLDRKLMNKISRA
jgi:hypothetical protein